MADITKIKLPNGQTYNVKDANLATVASSGSYNDLTNKPTLGAAAACGVDTAPASGSTNLITSGAVYTVVGDINSVLEEVL